MKKYPSFPYDIDPHAPDILTRHGQAVYRTGICGIEEIRGEAYEHIQLDQAGQKLIAAVMPMNEPKTADDGMNDILLPQQWNDEKSIEKIAVRLGKAIVRDYGCNVHLINIKTVASQPQEKVDCAISYINQIMCGFAIVTSCDFSPEDDDEKDKSYSLLSALSELDAPTIRLGSTSVSLLKAEKIAPVKELATVT